MYSQLLQIGEVLEHVGRKLRDVVHAQVTAEGKHWWGARKWGREKTKKRKAVDGIHVLFIT